LILVLVIVVGNKGKFEKNVCKYYALIGVSTNLFSQALFCCFGWPKTTHPNL